MIDKETIDGAVKLKSLSSRNKRELSDEERMFLDMEDSKEVDTPVIEDDTPQTHTVTIASQKPSISYTRVDEEIIVIKDHKKRVSLSYTHEEVPGKPLTFLVSVPAASVEVQKNGVSILISKDIIIQPPTLTPCTLETDESKFSVIFAGATHTIGNYINMPFIIVE